jgi:hypothetical protein
MFWGPIGVKLFIFINYRLAKTGNASIKRTNFIFIIFKGLIQEHELPHQYSEQRQHSKQRDR